MKKNLLTMSLPAKPREKTTIGMLLAPIIMDLLAAKTGSERMISLNTIHTYSSPEKFVSIYLNDIDKWNIEYDYFFEDKENSKLLLSVLETMIKEGIVYEKEEYIYTCDCGIVEFIKNGLCYGNGKLYKNTNGKLTCNKCASQLTLKKKKVLVLKYKADGENVKVIPSFLEKEMNYFVNLFNNQEILISKDRKTGYSLIVNNNIYNIDVEFIWSQLYGINNQNKIMIASNHQVYTMFIINLFNRYFKKSNIIFVLTPYMNDLTKFENFEEKFNQLSLMKKKLYIIYSLNWKKKTCSWDYGLYKKIRKLDENKIKLLYDYVYSELQFDTLENLYNRLEIFFMKELNFDKNVKAIL